MIPFDNSKILLGFFFAKVGGGGHRLISRDIHVHAIHLALLQPLQSPKVPLFLLHQASIAETSTPNELNLPFGLACEVLLKSLCMTHQNSVIAYETDLLEASTQS